MSNQWKGTIQCHVKNILVTDVQRRKDGYYIEGNVNIRDEQTIPVVITTRLFDGENLCEETVGEGKGSKPNPRLQFQPLLKKGVYLTAQSLGGCLRLTGLTANNQLSFEWVGTTFDAQTAKEKEKA